MEDSSTLTRVHDPSESRKAAAIAMPTPGSGAQKSRARSDALMAMLLIGFR